ncbi:hypothetical protein L1887_52849 [Cichorium endivia]|nr:hypothetical protein L1887_52849 [Cichorium endivia]
MKERLRTLCQGVMYARSDRVGRSAGGASGGDEALVLGWWRQPRKDEPKEWMRIGSFLPHLLGCAGGGTLGLHHRPALLFWQLLPLCDSTTTDPPERWICRLSSCNLWLRNPGFWPRFFPTLPRARPTRSGNQPKTHLRPNNSTDHHLARSASSRLREFTILTDGEHPIDVYIYDSPSPPCSDPHHPLLERILDMLDDELQAALDRRAAKGTLRQLTVYPTASTSVSSSSSSEQPLVDFSSNDYLSLATSSRVRADFAAIIASDSPLSAQLGSAGSRLLDGNSSVHEAVENDLTRHFASSTAGLLFNSGYEANVSLLSTLPQPKDVVIYDELVHASVHDGLRRSRVPAHLRIPFRHNSVDHLREILTRLVQDGTLTAGTSAAPGEQRNVWLAVESIYSMDGDACPLRALLDTLSQHVPQHRICAVVDEAHSTAVYGSRGRGLVNALGLQDDPRITARLMTFGKAWGASGAIVLCSKIARHYLINYARPLIFSTALGYPQLASILAAFRSVQDGSAEKRARATFGNARRLVDGLEGVIRSQSPAAKRTIALPPHLKPKQQAQLAVEADDDFVRWIGGRGELVCGGGSRRGSGAIADLLDDGLGATGADPCGAVLDHDGGSAVLLGLGTDSLNLVQRRIGCQQRVVDERSHLGLGGRHRRRRLDGRQRLERRRQRGKQRLDASCERLLSNGRHLDDPAHVGSSAQAGSASFAFPTFIKLCRSEEETGRGKLGHVRKNSASAMSAKRSDREICSKWRRRSSWLT